MYFDIDDRLRWAMRLKAGKDNVPSLALLARKLIEEAVAKELDEVDRRMAEGESPKQAKSPRGRRPKQSE